MENLDSTESLDNFCPHYRLYSRCFPDFPTAHETFLEQLRPEQGQVFAHWEGDALAGFAFLRGDSLTMLCVEESSRCRGIGGSLLAQAERAARERGEDRLVLGQALLQGVPQGPAVDFFRKRGYEAQWSSINMELRLADFSLEKLEIPPTPAEVRFRFAEPGDRKALLAAVEEAEPSWVSIFETCGDPVFLAVLGEEIAGFQILSTEGGRFGRPGDPACSIGCVGVVPRHRERGIGLAMVAKGAQWLKEQNCARVELRYTWLEDWYGKLGFVTTCRQWMGEKPLQAAGSETGKI